MVADPLFGVDSFVDSSGFVFSGVFSPAAAVADAASVAASSPAATEVASDGFSTAAAAAAAEEEEEKKLGSGDADVIGLAKAAETEKVWRRGALAGLDRWRGETDSDLQGSLVIARIALDSASLISASGRILTPLSWASDSVASGSSHSTFKA